MAAPSQASTSASGPIAVFRSMSGFHRAKFAFLAAAAVSLMISVALWFSGSREEGLFVGLWVPAIHSLGTLVLTGERDGGSS